MRAFFARLKTELGLDDGPTKPPCRFDSSLAEVMDDFRQQRSADLARMIETVGERGAHLASTQAELNRWKEYARKLEHVCLTEGLALPQAPDD